jgi:hypothetical protein
MIWDRQHRGEPTLAYANGIAEFRRSGLAGSRLPHLLDQGPGPYAPR